jgi:acrylyl-CoA reductase (NADPH)
MAPLARRTEAWQRLAQDIDRAALALIARRIGLAEALAAAPGILAGQVRGRLVVDVRQ